MLIVAASSQRQVVIDMVIGVDVNEVMNTGCTTGGDPCQTTLTFLVRCASRLAVNLELTPSEGALEELESPQTWRLVGAPDGLGYDVAHTR